MSGFCHYAMQSSLHGKLESDAPLMDMVTGVFDFVPPKTPFPYVTIGDMRVSDVSTMGQVLLEVEPVLHVYSRAKGRKEISDIMNEMHRLLHDGDLDVAGYDLIGLRFLGSDIEQERDGMTYHGRMRLRAVVQKN